MFSNVGDSRIYEDNEQRPPKTTKPKQGEIDRRERMEHGPEPIHHLDERNLSAEEQRQVHIQESRETAKDPLKPAIDHGHKPSRGAEIDAELQKEDEEMLKKKTD
ncbi:hypothetical protein Agabi119p4_7239 [Agaricus bisporus var. burnettii]|uniref:Uncharacterized protein n=1 Tax=Agaricus bisporus var. burnettii TaxID=192524 RepID=A0A8H7C6V4_AGABI|nr:hypothetical protein Agabi119p4_7239 [Agaricus bisporus var. burnettii]